MIIGILFVIGGHGTLTDFFDTEVSIGNAFETGIWRDGSIKVDIIPGTCPNPIDVKTDRDLPVAILGTQDFPVDDLDPTSVRIWRNVNGEYIGGNVLPIVLPSADTATPFYPTPGGDCCHDLAGDGIVDLNVEFEKLALVGDLELEGIPHGTTIYLRVTVLVLDDEGNRLEGGDCVVILNEP